LRRSLFAWPDDAPLVSAAIRASRAPCKICLKTRNDPIFLAEWHQHHARIVGAENLIIADNMSDDPEVLAQLHELSRQSTVFQFTGFHNRLHERELFSPLYRVIEDSSDWHLVLDTDERLVWIEEENWIADSRLVDRLRCLPPSANTVPGVLIQNLPGSRTHFRLPADPSQSAAPLQWGKPAIATGCSWPKGGPIHNIQFPPEIFAARQPPRLFQLHLCNLDPEQRLRANREKLAARGICAPDSSYAEIAQIDVELETRSVVRRSVLQTRRLLADELEAYPDQIIVRSDGHLDFSSPAVRSAFHALMTGGADYLAEMAGKPC